ARQVRRVRPAVRPPPTAGGAPADAAPVRHRGAGRPRSRVIAWRAFPFRRSAVQIMFVFKAAVVGAGTMGGQIAQTIASAGIPVVLRDIDEPLVQAGLDKARNVTRGHVAELA